MNSVFSILFLLNVSLISPNEQKDISPFTSTATAPQSNAKVTSIAASISGNKITIYWTVEENQSADLFELEKSTDGKNFTMAALVFGTDKQETGKYEFFETAVSNQLVSYRIKLVNKNKIAEYSKTVQAIKQ